MKYIINRHNTHTHCVFFLLRDEAGLEDFRKEEESDRLGGWTHIKTLSIIPVQDEHAFVHDPLHPGGELQYC